METNQHYKPEDFWPDAEKLLDKHFAQKSKFGFKGGIIAGMALLIGSLSIWLFLRNYDSNQVASSSEKTTKNLYKSENQTNHPAKKQEISNYQTNDLKLTKTEQEKTSSDLKNPEKSPTASPFIENASKTETNKVANTGSKAELNQLKKPNDESTWRSEKPKTKNHFSQTKQNEFDPKLKAATNEGSNSPALPSENTGKNQSLSNLRIGTNVVSKSSGNTPDLNKNAAPHSIQKTLNPSSEKSGLNSNASSANSSIGKTNQFKCVTLNPLKYAGIQQETLSEFIVTSPTTYEASSAEKKKPKPVISCQLGAGLFNVSKRLSSSTNPDYVNRRRAEEQQTNYASWMFGAKIQYKRFALNTGIELNQYGEQIKYSNWLMGNSNLVNNSWSPTIDSLVNVGHYYIQGNEFTQTNIQYITDSVLVSDTSIVYGQKASDASEFNSKTMFSYIEIPFVLDYEIYAQKRFTFALRSGVSVGFLKERRGYYLDNNLEEFTELNKATVFRSTMWNMRLGIDLNYYIVPKTSIFIRPEFRANLQSTFKSETGITQKYRAYGVMIGISRSF
jgi:hypothetical protein